MKDKPLPSEIKHEQPKHETVKEKSSEHAQKPREPREKKPPKKITSNYLHNAGLYYLQRFSSSSGNFREIMIRKIKRSCAHHTDQDFEHCLEALDETVQKFIDVGLINDETYTRGMVHSLRRQGKSKRAIEAKLRTKNVPQNLVKLKIEEYDEEHKDADTELISALILARKRKIGPYKKESFDENTDIKKHLSIMARAGFSYDTSSIVLKMGVDYAETIVNR